MPDCIIATRCPMFVALGACHASPDVGTRRRADQAGDRRDGGGEPARRDPGGRRGHAQGRGVLRRVPGAWTERRSGGDHPAGNRPSPDARQGTPRGGAVGGVLRLGHREHRRGVGAAERLAARDSRHRRRLPDSIHARVEARLRHYADAGYPCTGSGATAMQNGRCLSLCGWPPA
jgi:hypothetical protein